MCLAHSQRPAGNYIRADSSRSRKIWPRVVKLVREASKQASIDQLEETKTDKQGAIDVTDYLLADITDPGSDNEWKRFISENVGISRKETSIGVKRVTLGEFMCKLIAEIEK